MNDDNDNSPLDVCPICGMFNHNGFDMCFRCEREIYLSVNKVANLNKEIKPMENAMMILQPYWTGGTWAFDDPRVGLVAEPFVLGIPEIMDDMLKVAKIEKKDVLEGFKLIFSANEFPKYHKKLTWLREEGSGNWYKCGKKEGWLCPALFKYFAKAPKEIYARAEKL